MPAIRFVHSFIPHQGSLLRLHWWRGRPRPYQVDGLALRMPQSPQVAVLTGPAYLCGLRQNEQDRSNVAIENLGSSADGEIAVVLTVFPGDGSTSSSHLPEVTLAPGGFTQINGILQSNGSTLTSGYVRVERVRGSAPFYAYGVINDQANSDGSFISPVSEACLVGKTSMTLPVVVEANQFSTELVATNFSAEDKTPLDLRR